MILTTRTILTAAAGLTLLVMSQSQAEAGKPHRGGAMNGMAKQGMAKKGMIKHGMVKHGSARRGKAKSPHFGVARSPFFGYGYGYGYNHTLGGPFEMPYAMGRIPTPPYFALHPPVHYSHAVPRTYGYSPFAYPGIFMTPEVEAVEPLEVINPHVEPEASSEADTTNHVAVAPLVIRNPFVDQSDEIPAGDLPTIDMASTISE